MISAARQPDQVRDSQIQKPVRLLNIESGLRPFQDRQLLTQCEILNGEITSRL
jgi:hypothetical protein